MGEVGNGATFVRYRLTNRSADRQTGELILAVRPAQINPSWQYGGLSELNELTLTTHEGIPFVVTNGRPTFGLSKTPDRTNFCKFEGGDIARYLACGDRPNALSVNDPQGLASGALDYSFDLKPGESLELTVAVPLHNSLKPIHEGLTRFEDCHRLVASKWRDRIKAVQIVLPDSDLVDCLRTQLTYILLTQHGNALQPGNRNYNRVWMRDGSLMADAVMRMGHPDAMIQLVNWYARSIQQDGLVPPVLLNDGTVYDGFGSNLEWDSQGEYVFAVMNAYRHTQDLDFLNSHYPKMRCAMAYTQRLRETTLEPAYRADEAAPERFRGILPESISHEGYFPPMHSYWDDYFAIKGWQDLAEAATILDKQDDRQWATKQGQELWAATRSSLIATMQHKGICYVPGCAEKGELDATSTSIAFYPCNTTDLFSDEAISATYDDYIAGVAKRYEKGANWAYTPYEVRNLTALAWLHRQDDARLLLRHIMESRRPAGWHCLGEVIYSDPRLGAYIGDMPHTWVAAEFVNAVLNMLTSHATTELELFKGALPEWFLNQGLKVTDLPTALGRISFEANLRSEEFRVQLNHSLPSSVKIRVFWPKNAKPKSVMVDGKSLHTCDYRSCLLPSTAKLVTVVW